MILKRLLLTLLLLLGLQKQGVWAADRLWGQYSVGDTTDRINYRDFWLRGTKNERNLLWPYKNEYFEEQSFDVDYYHRLQKGRNFKFKINELTGSYGYRFKEKHFLKVTGGGYKIDEESYPGSSFKTTGELNLLSRFSKDFNTTFFIGRSSGVREVFMTGPNVHDIRNTRVGTRLQRQFLDQLLVAKIDIIRNYLQNDVERTFFDSELMVSLMKFPHWVRLGVGYHTLDYNKATNNYWSPTDFYAFGPRVDLAYLIKENLQAYFGGNYNWFEENKTFSGTGYYLRTGLQYGIREDYIIDASYERNESVQNNNKWVGKAFYLNVNYFF